MLFLFLLFFFEVNAFFTRFSIYLVFLFSFFLLCCFAVVVLVVFFFITLFRSVTVKYKKG